MTPKKLAEILNGRTIGNEITPTEAADAKDAGLIVLFGASDDLAEFRGAIYDESNCYGGGDLFVSREGPLIDHSDSCKCDYCGYNAARAKCATIKALWCAEPGWSWTYKTAIPHETFTIVEDEGFYCRGIVFRLEDLPAYDDQRSNR